MGSTGAFGGSGVPRDGCKPVVLEVICRVSCKEPRSFEGRGRSQSGLESEAQVQVAFENGAAVRGAGWDNSRIDLSPDTEASMDHLRGITGRSVAQDLSCARCTALCQSRQEQRQKQHPDMSIRAVLC